MKFPIDYEDLLQPDHGYLCENRGYQFNPFTLIWYETNCTCLSKFRTRYFDLFWKFGPTIAYSVPQIL